MSVLHLEVSKLIKHFLIGHDAKKDIHNLTGNKAKRYLKV